MLVPRCSIVLIFVPHRHVVHIKNTMEEKMSVQPIPNGNNAVSPYLVVSDAKALLQFVKEGLGATEKEVHMQDGVVMHAEVTIGDSVIMIGSMPEGSAAFRSMVHIYTEDCDDLYQRAVQAGGVSIREPRDEFYGNRTAAVRDAFGNEWWIATHTEEVSEAEMQKRIAAMTASSE